MFVRNKGLFFMLSLLAIIVVLTGCGTAKDSEKTEGKTARETQETMDYASKSEGKSNCDDYDEQ